VRKLALSWRNGTGHDVLDLLKRPQGVGRSFRLLGRLSWRLSDLNGLGQPTSNIGTECNHSTVSGQTMMAKTIAQMTIQKAQVMWG
jgi:hypothetical protein